MVVVSWLLVPTSTTITVLVAEYLQIKALAVHFKTFWLSAVASDLLQFWNFLKPLLFLSIAVYVHSPKRLYCMNFINWGLVIEKNVFSLTLHYTRRYDAFVCRVDVNMFLFYFLYWNSLILDIHLILAIWPLLATFLYIVGNII